MARPRYVRHRIYDRTRHSQHFLSWLDAQADRLLIEPEALFNGLLIAQGLTFEQVEALPDGVPPAG